MEFNCFLIATSNPGKFKEVKLILHRLFSTQCLGAKVVFMSLKDISVTKEVEEDGQTYEENAIKKALEACLKSRLPSVADDSGLEVDVLGGRPGINSRYYGGEISFKKKRAVLLKELEGITVEERKARFVCVVALALPDGRLITAKGEVSGYITSEDRGEKGFGYDPVFLYPPMNKTFGEMEEEEKNLVSHRAKALESLVLKLRLLS